MHLGPSCTKRLQRNHVLLPILLLAALREFKDTFSLSDLCFRLSPKLYRLKGPPLRELPFSVLDGTSLYLIKERQWLRSPCMIVNVLLAFSRDRLDLIYAVFFTHRRTLTVTHFLVQGQDLIPEIRIGIRTVSPAADVIEGLLRIPPLGKDQVSDDNGG